MRNVMETAVKFARKMEGDWIACMALGLKMSWALVKKAAKKSLSEIASEIKEAFLEEGISVSANVWEKYGKSRIYINAGYSLKIGYFEFENGEYVKSFGEYSDWDCGKTTSQFKTIKSLFENNAF